MVKCDVPPRVSRVIGLRRPPARDFRTSQRRQQVQGAPARAREGSGVHVARQGGGVIIVAWLWPHATCGSMLLCVVMRTGQGARYSPYRGDDPGPLPGILPGRYTAYQL